VIVILDGNEAKRLQYSVSQAPQGIKSLRHAVHRATLRLECYLDEISLHQRLRQPQESAGHGNGLEVCLRASAVFQTDRRQDRIA
jgi:hypothetical protein